ncbi:MAG TPA: SDR family oxidoreductase [Acidimicrobiia bacterium]|nr:SDR family oxidoreductase [Acidimicrobiia bacterium]
MNQTNDSVAIVTGASRGLGLATARALAETGWSLIIDAREPNALETAAREIGGHTMVAAIAGDVSDQVHRRQLIEAAGRAGGLDLLVNNASILGPSPQPPIGEYPLDVLRQVYEVNVFAPVALIQESLPLLRKRHGVVINITSDAATERYPGWGGYGSSKASLNQISNILAAENPEVAVYSFDPGDMNTQMHQEAFPGEDISDRPPPERSVPALLDLIERRPDSGHYQAGQLLSAT